MIDYEKCPHCGSCNNVIGKQSGYARVTANKCVTFKEQTLYHIICLDCGTIIRSFIKNPKRLVVKK